ncbi:MAG TPA: chemotaxis protein CheB [Polyangiaceae bacterium]|nr:chemotaxis protein CheB [Polyangiaceae bacterium]
MTDSKSPDLAAIVVGGSAGALEALDRILRALPSTLPVPIAIVLHMLPGRPSGLSALLSDRTPLSVKEAEDKEPLAPGTVYLASPNYHLLVERSRTFSLSVDEPVLFSRPSIDVLFDSAAEAFGAALCGVLLSGANEDGAQGLRHIGAAGGTTVVQAPHTASSPQMPAAALAAGKVDHVLPVEQIGPLLARLARTAPSSAPLFAEARR